MISVADAPSVSSTKSREVSNSHEFEEHMTNLFEKIYDPVWMNKKSTVEKEEATIANQGVNQILND